MEYVRNNGDGTITLRSDFTFLTVTIAEADFMCNELVALLNQLELEDDFSGLPVPHLDDTIRSLPQGIVDDMPTNPLSLYAKWLDEGKPAIGMFTNPTDEATNEKRLARPFRMFAPYRSALDRAPHLRLIKGGKE